MISAYSELNRWAPDAHKLQDYIRNHPLPAWEMLREIFRRAKSRGLEYSAMTWSLERLLAEHGSATVDAVAEFAVQNQYLQHCLQDIDAHSDRVPEKYRVPAEIRARALAFGASASAGKLDANVQPLDKSLEEIVEAWINYTKLFWAFDYVHDLVRANPGEAIELTRRLIDAALDPMALAVVAAGPLEDLLRYHCSEVISRVEEFAASDEKFRTALGGVWLNEGDEAFTRVKSLIDRYDIQPL